MNHAESTTVQLWLSPQELAELEHQRQAEAYAREAMATAQSEAAFEALQEPEL